MRRLIHWEKNQRVSFIFQNPVNYLKRESQFIKESKEEMREEGRKQDKREEKTKDGEEKGSFYPRDIFYYPPLCDKLFCQHLLAMKG